MCHSRLKCEISTYILDSINIFAYDFENTHYSSLVTICNTAKIYVLYFCRSIIFRKFRNKKKILKNNNRKIINLISFLPYLPVLVLHSILMSDVWKHKRFVQLAVQVPMSISFCVIYKHICTSLNGYYALFVLFCLCDFQVPQWG